jgi:chromosomal replication initiation ATPase DnaA
MKPETIKKIIDRTFGVDIGSNSRSHQVVYPRFVYCYLAYMQKNEKYSQEAIGKVINRNHASVLNAIRQFDKLARYKDFQYYVQKAEKAISESLEVEMIRREKLRLTQCTFRIKRYSSPKTT